ncbi:hypothetical protein QE152_g32388 [Popillia japonica]|uniref:Uncharacterized protein n=1 Tax=Popillia japonica TaxID=7064 RepID=A0AAW1IZY2_POPJA
MSCHLQYYIGCTSMDPSYALTEVQTMMYIPDSSPISWWPIIFLAKEEIDFQGKQIIMLPLKKIMSTWTMSETADAEAEINFEVTYSPWTMSETADAEPEINVEVTYQTKS